MKPTADSDRPLRVNMISESVFTVQAHGVHTAFLEMTNGLRTRGDVDVEVNTFRPADITHIQTVGTYALRQLFFGRGKKVVSVHIIPDSFLGSLVAAKYWYGAAKWYLRWFYNRANRLLAVSPMVKDTLVNDMKVKPPVDVVYNTIDTSKYTPSTEKRQKAREALGLAPDDFVVISVGQVQPRKRYDVFIRLAKEHPDWKMIWVGGVPFKYLGADYAHIQEMTKSAPDNMRTTGVITLEEVRPYYLAADVFVLLSDQENHPMSVIEAAASGLPIVLRKIEAYAASFGDRLLYGNDQTFGGILERLRSDHGYYRQAVEGSTRVANLYDNVRGAQILVEEYQKTLEDK